MVPPPARFMTSGLQLLPQARPSSWRARKQASRTSKGDEHDASGSAYPARGCGSRRHGGRAGRAGTNACRGVRNREGCDRDGGGQRARAGHRRQFPEVHRRQVLRWRHRQSRGAPGQHRTARRRDPGHSVPDRPRSPAGAISTDSPGAHERHGVEAPGRHAVDGAQRARHGDEGRSPSSSATSRR